MLTRIELKDVIQGNDFLTLRKLVLTPCKCGTKLGLLPTLTIDHATLHLLDSMPLGAMVLTQKNTILRLPLVPELTQLIQGKQGHHYKKATRAATS